jgi:hypothetical protein
MKSGDELPGLSDADFLEYVGVDPKRWAYAMYADISANPPLTVYRLQQWVDRAISAGRNAATSPALTAEENTI